MPANPVDRYGGTEVKEISRRKKLFRGEREQFLQLTVRVGTVYSLLVPIQARDRVDQLVAALEKARDTTPS